MSADRLRLVDPAEQPAPRVDADTAAIVDDAIEAL